MTRIHQLNATVGSDGIHLALHCPYDEEPPGTLADYPDWMVPVCRPGRAAACAAAQAIAAGQLHTLWGATPTALHSGMKIQLWSDDNGLRIAAATDPETIEDLARNLARASRSPRYAGGNWTLLLTADANVEHAWREATRREIDHATVNEWRDRLQAWHWQRHGQTRTTLTRTD